jgi:hypothetical protein
MVVTGTEICTYLSQNEGLYLYIVQEHGCIGFLPHYKYLCLSLKGTGRDAAFPGILCMTLSILLCVFLIGVEMGLEISREYLKVVPGDCPNKWVNFRQDVMSAWDTTSVKRWMGEIISLHLPVIIIGSNKLYQEATVRTSVVTRVLCDPWARPSNELVICEQQWEKHTRT